MMMINFWLSRLSAEDKSTLKVAFFISIIVSVIITILAFLIDFVHISWGIFLLVGNITSSICYIKLVNNITDVLNGRYLKHKRAMFLNSLTSMVIYFIVLSISVLINTYALFWCALGILSIKFVIYQKNRRDVIG